MPHSLVKAPVSHWVCSSMLSSLHTFWTVLGSEGISGCCLLALFGDMWSYAKYILLTSNGIAVLVRKDLCDKKKTLALCDLIAMSIWSNSNVNHEPLESRPAPCMIGMYIINHRTSSSFKLKDDFLSSCECNLAITLTRNQLWILFSLSVETEPWALKLNGSVALADDSFVRVPNSWV